jgi:hypothetical protein
VRPKSAQRQTQSSGELVTLSSRQCQSQLHGSVSQVAHRLRRAGCVQKYIGVIDQSVSEIRQVYHSYAYRNGFRSKAMLIYLEQTNPFIQIFGQIHVDPFIRYICMRAFGEISRGLRSMFATLKRCQVMSDALDTPAKRFQQHARHYCALGRLQ